MDNKYIRFVHKQKGGTVVDIINVLTNDVNNKIRLQNEIKAIKTNDKIYDLLIEMNDPAPIKNVINSMSNMVHYDSLINQTKGGNF
jgi:hypothetical protein